VNRPITYPTSQVPPLSYEPYDFPATKEIVGIAAQSDFECLTTLLRRGSGL
jgi:hypothetical protein